MRLSKIRLLPVTIAVMSSVLLVKTVVLVQAVAGEAAQPAKADAAAPAQAAAPVAPVAELPPAPTGPNPGQNDAPKPAAPAVPAASGAAQAGDPPPVSDAERSILLDLRKRREELEARDRALDERQKEQDAANKRLDERVQQLTALQSRLEALEATRQQHKQENWTGLVKVYENMKPRDAAAIFDALDMQVLLQVLDRMQERKVAPILAAMQPDRARLATQLLAEMRTRAITPSNPQPKG
jgi:flagellar motility protein MotE (MotC chaperone)